MQLLLSFASEVYSRLTSPRLFQQARAADTRIGLRDGCGSAYGHEREKEKERERK